MEREMSAANKNTKSTTNADDVSDTKPEEMAWDDIMISYNVKYIKSTLQMVAIMLNLLEERRSRFPNTSWEKLEFFFFFGYSYILSSKKNSTRATNKGVCACLRENYCI